VSCPATCGDGREENAWFGWIVRKGETEQNVGAGLGLARDWGSQQDTVGAEQLHDLRRAREPLCADSMTNVEQFDAARPLVRPKIDAAAVVQVVASGIRNITQSDVDSIRLWIMLEDHNCLLAEQSPTSG
jgi:hypothetical protein